MKKALSMMILGASMGAGAVVMYDQYKSGNLKKMVSKAGKEVNKMLDNMD